jgi:predicted nucleotidyltransferase
MADARDQIIEGLKAVLEEIKGRHDIKEAYLFGSYARGNPEKHSDVDVAVVLGSFRNGSLFDERFEIFHEFQERSSLFEVVCISEDDFRRGETTIVRIIKREGIKLL